MDLIDRVALITGASGGLGAVTARILADDGAHVAVTHLGHREEAVEVCHQIEATGRKAFLVQLDQPDPRVLCRRGRSDRQRSRAPRHSRQQCRLERPDSASGPRLTDARDLGPRRTPTFVAPSS